MRILYCSPYEGWPLRSGGQVRIYALARALARMGHQVTLLAGAPVGEGADFPSTNGGGEGCGGCEAGQTSREAGQTGGDGGGEGSGALAWRPYRFIPRRGYFINLSFYQAFREALDALRPDLVVAAFPYQSRMICGPARRRGVPVFYDAHNVEADRFASAGQPVMARIVRAFEGYLCRQARRVLAVSEEDRRLFRHYYGVECDLLPNGVDGEQFRPGPRDGALLAAHDLAGRPLALFTGTLDYGPNREAVEFLGRRCWPDVLRRHPEARLVVVGRGAPDWLGETPGVVVAGAVDDMAAWLRLAHVALAPLRSGGGTRLKILEAMACGQTVLSTPFGAQGIASASRPGLILAELDDFTGRLADLLDTPPEPGASAAARAFAEGFDWLALARAVDWRPGGV